MIFLPKKTQNEKHTQNILVLIVLIALGFFFKGKVSGQEFNSEKWKYSNLNAEDNWDLRWSMMNSLRNNYELKGKTKSEIIGLLGKSDNEIRDEISYSLS